MKCKECKDLIDEGVWTSEVEAHLEICEDCKSYARVSEALRGLRSQKDEEHLNLWSVFQERLRNRRTFQWKKVWIPAGLAFSLAVAWLGVNSNKIENLSVARSLTSVKTVYELASGGNKSVNSSLDYYYKILNQ